MALFGAIMRSISLNRMTIRLNRSHNFPQTGTFSLRNIITKQPLIVFMLMLSCSYAHAQSDDTGENTKDNKSTGEGWVIEYDAGSDPAQPGNSMGENWNIEYQAKPHTDTSDKTKTQSDTSNSGAGKKTNTRGIELIVGGQGEEGLAKRATLPISN